ncbi:MAG: dienelactone hydrolase family protein, partial [Gammaproteobacteria bacterium]|nr:dienelactone hydrolase family protein [Gammaproteobacteria bacterium]
KDAKGYLAEPIGDGPFGSIILIHEWNGVVERIKQVADALANEGYLALAADLYSGKTGSTTQENIALMREARANPDEIIGNLNAAAKFLRERPDSNGHIATVGWCFGGGVALSFAIGGEHHEGTAIFYGQLLDDPEELAKIEHEMLGTFAGEDRMIPIEQVNSFAQALKSVGVANDIHIYDHVQHGFWLYVERDPETNREPAKHAWDRLSEFFNRVLSSDE